VKDGFHCESQSRKRPDILSEVAVLSQYLVSSYPSKTVNFFNRVEAIINCYHDSNLVGLTITDVIELEVPFS
jgi:hypothetical protein